MIKNTRIGFTALCLVFFTPIFFAAVSARAESEPLLTKGQTVYVSVYSHVLFGDRPEPFLLAATLTVRNTDMKHAITMESVDYYDSDGKLLKSYLPQPVSIGSQASTFYFVQESDKSGGLGAHFIVRWKSDKLVNTPIIEAIMIGTRSQQGISFISRGQVLNNHEK